MRRFSSKNSKTFDCKSKKWDPNRNLKNIIHPLGVKLTGALLEEMSGFPAREYTEAFGFGNSPIFLSMIVDVEYNLVDNLWHCFPSNSMLPRHRYNEDTIWYGQTMSLCLPSGGRRSMKAIAPPRVDGSLKSSDNYVQVSEPIAIGELSSIFVLVCCNSPFFKNLGNAKFLLANVSVRFYAPPLRKATSMPPLSEDHEHVCLACR